MRFKAKTICPFLQMPQKPSNGGVTFGTTKWAASSFSLVLTFSSLDTVINKWTKEKLPSKAAPLTKGQQFLPVLGFLWQRWLYFISFVHNVISLKLPFQLLGSKKYYIPALALASRSWVIKPWKKAYTNFFLKKNKFFRDINKYSTCFIILEPSFSQQEYMFLKQNYYFLLGFSQIKKIQKLLWGPDLSFIGSLEAEGVVLSFISLMLS